MKLSLQQTKARRRTFLLDGKGGFSLVELLVVITILGIFSMIAVVAMGLLMDNVNENKTKQDAQMLATIAAGAQAAGVELTGSTEDVLLQIKAGMTGTGVFANAQFAALDFTAEEITEVQKFLQWNGRDLIYSPTGF
ncbi:MAG: type II secretion system protein [Verrucomicrobiales bacterium]